MSTTPPASPQAVPAQPEAEGRRPQDCMACRLTGAAAFTGAGGYALYTAAEQGAFARVRPPGAPVFAGKVSALIGVAMVGLGIGRLFI